MDYELADLNGQKRLFADVLSVFGRVDIDAPDPPCTDEITPGADIDAEVIRQERIAIMMFDGGLTEELAMQLCDAAMGN